MTPTGLFSVLSDQTRLRSLMLIQAENEVCVCELTFALEESQPKISRHLALMRDEGIVVSRREGNRMYYRINADLPRWARKSLDSTLRQLGQLDPFSDDRDRLKSMTNRPGVDGCG